MRVGPRKWIVIAVLGCRTAPVSSDPPTVAPVSVPLSAPPTRPVDAGAPPAFSRCEPPPPDVPPLTSFMVVDKAHPYWVPMVFEGPAWQPAELIRPPYHHGSRLELDNIDAFPQLDSQRGRRLRFTVTLTTIDAWKIPDKRQWRSLYHATILSICELEPVPPR